MAARYWVAQPVSGAIVSVTTAPEIRLTVASTTGMTTGDTSTVTSVGGTTEANGTWVITVIDSTHIDLQGTTFANVYTSGGAVNGRWSTTNTNNWVSSTGGTNYGQTVPGSADTIIFDGSSGGGTVISTITTLTTQSISSGTFTGTLTLTSLTTVTLTGAASAWFACSGTSTRNINIGSGTWNLTGNGGNVAMWNLAVVTGLTDDFNDATINITNTGTVSSSFSGGGKNYGTVNFIGHANRGGHAISGTNTFAAVGVTSPNSMYFPNTGTTTITAAFTYTGTAVDRIFMSGNNSNVVSVIAATGGGSLGYGVLKNISVTGTANATNTLDLGGNTWTSIAAPPAGGGARVIGG